LFVNPELPMSAVMSTRSTTRAFFDPNTWTVSYVVRDHASRRAA